MRDYNLILKSVRREAKREARNVDHAQLWSLIPSCMKGVKNA